MAGTDSNTSDLDQAIAENAAGPAKASVDSQSVEQHPLSDVIEADRYRESKKASRKPGIGIRFAKLVPPGTEDHGGAA